MTDKDLLLKDLSARLPYGVKCHVKYGPIEGDITLDCIDNNVVRFDYGWYGRFHVSINADYIKPYLFPLSSMTEEQLFDVQEILGKTEIKIEDDLIRIVDSDRNTFSYSEFLALFELFYKNHFDINNLIPAGLAIDATGLNIY